MKVKTITNGAFALTCRDMVHFGKDRIFKEGQLHGVSHIITEENLKGMVHHKLAEFHNESDAETDLTGETEENADAETESDAEGENAEAESGAEKLPFEDITDKAELVQHAKEFYGVELDERKSIRKLVRDLKAVLLSQRTVA